MKVQRILNKNKSWPRYLAIFKEIRILPIYIPEKQTVFYFHRIQGLIYILYHILLRKDLTKKRPETVIFSRQRKKIKKFTFN